MIDFKRLIDPIKRKLFLIIGRAILTAVDNSGTTQKIQVTLLKDENASDIERLQNFGFDSVPKTTNSECVIAFINGNRDQGLALIIQDNDNRPVDLLEGETAVYDANTHSIKLQATGITITTGDAAVWAPCVVTNCLYSGAPHGGVAGGIVKLKGA